MLFCVCANTTIPRRIAVLCIRKSDMGQLFRFKWFLFGLNMRRIHRGIFCGSVFECRKFCGKYPRSQGYKLSLSRNLDFDNGGMLFFRIMAKNAKHKGGIVDRKAFGQY